MEDTLEVAPCESAIGQTRGISRASTGTVLRLAGAFCIFLPISLVGTISKFRYGRAELDDSPRFLSLFGTMVPERCFSRLELIASRCKSSTMPRPRTQSFTNPQWK